MQYIGKLSGHGMLKCNGRALADAEYEIDVFRLNQGLVKASGEITLSRSLSANLTGVAKMQLLTEAGDLLDIKRPNAELPISRHLDFEVTGNLDSILGQLP